MTWGRRSLNFPFVPWNSWARQGRRALPTRERRRSRASGSAVDPWTLVVSWEAGGCGDILGSRSHEERGFGRGDGDGVGGRKHRRRRSKAGGREDWFKKVGAVPLGSLWQAWGPYHSGVGTCMNHSPTSRAEVKSPVTPSAGEDVQQMKPTRCCGS